MEDQLYLASEISKIQRTLKSLAVSMTIIIFFHLYHVLQLNRDTALRPYYLVIDEYEILIYHIIFMFF